MRHAILAAFLLAATGATAAPPLRNVDVSSAAALGRLQVENPSHYPRVVEALRIASEVSCETLPGILKVRLEAAAARCSRFLVLASFPAKRHVAFVLDDTRYSARVVLWHGGKLMPAQ